MTNNDLIKYACNRLGYQEKELSELIICEVLGSLISDLIQDYLPQNITVDSFLHIKHHFYFHKGGYHSPPGQYVFFHKDYYYFTCIGDKGEVTNITSSKWIKDILFPLFWIIAFYISYQHSSLKTLQEKKKSKIEIFLALMEKAGIY